MTQKELTKLSAAERVAWLNEEDPFHQWAVGQDVYCLHCDGVFKAEDVACDREGDPTCPVCHSSTPLDFFALPWWREDLVKSVDGEEQHAWKVEPIHAIPGKPRSISRPELN